MSREANPKVIGAFVIGAMVLVLAGVLILGSGKFFTTRPRYVLYFDTSVAGLNAGAPVLLQGVRVGQVVSVQAEFDLKEKAVRIEVIIEVDSNAVSVVGGKLTEVGGGKGVELLVEQGMRGQLAMQSFITGQLYILFTFPPNVPLKHVKYGGEYPELPTVPSPIEKLTKKLENLNVQKLADSLTNTLEGVEKLINSPEILETIRTVEATAKDLRKLVQNANNKIDSIASVAQETMRDTRKLVQTAVDKVETIGTGTNTAVQDVRQLISNLNNKIDALSASLDGAIQDARNLMKNVDGAVGPIKTELGETLKLAADALKEASLALKNIQTATSDNSPLRYKLLETLDRLSGAADSIRNWADYLERHPEALIRGKGDK